MGIGNFISQFVTVMLGSGASIAIARIVSDHRRDKRQRADAAEYLALQLAFLLEGYAIDCAGKVSDHSMAVSSEGHVGKEIGAVPASPSFPESDAYKLLDRAILNDLLDFPQRCRMAQEAAMAWWDVVGDEDACSTAMLENTLSMGGAAIEIAKGLRKKYALGDRSLKFGEWDIESFFVEELRTLAERVAKRKRADEVAEIFPEPLVPATNGAP